MTKSALLLVAASFAIMPSCQTNFCHQEDNYSQLYAKGWRRSIGTDHHAGNNDYLYLDEFPIEWSFYERGSGFLYTTEPMTNDIVWSFKGVHVEEVDQRAIKIKDGTTVTATNEAGVSYEIMIVLQTEYYCKIFYRRLDMAQGTDPQAVQPIQRQDNP